ncbi:hypothetical protein MWU59_09330 [Flavobacteriaceae bacterium F08102]|nr:hypothetical protein [Flavobacteriaceae bacterium F08102]
MFKTIVFLVGLLSVVNCSDDRDYTGIDGDYIGDFTRGTNRVNVWLKLNENEYTGQSEQSKFPALCTGTYTIKENTIFFEDQCVWSAEFDWSLILSDSWQYTMKKDSLILWNSHGDRYRLKRH